MELFAGTDFFVDLVVTQTNGTHAETSRLLAHKQYPAVFITPSIWSVTVETICLAHYFRSKGCFVITRIILGYFL